MPRFRPAMRPLVARQQHRSRRVDSRSEDIRARELNLRSARSKRTNCQGSSWIPISPSRLLQPQPPSCSWYGASVGITDTFLCPRFRGRPLRRARRAAACWLDARHRRGCTRIAARLRFSALMSVRFSYHSLTVPRSPATLDYSWIKPAEHRSEEDARLDGWRGVPRSSLGSLPTSARETGYLISKPLFGCIAVSMDKCSPLT